MDKLNFEALRRQLKKTGVKTASALRELLAESDSKSRSIPDGPLSARDRLVYLFDEGTFCESGVFVRRRSSEFDETAPDEFEGVICGWGAINGELVYAFSQDMSRTKGAMSEAHAKKICDVYRLAVENGAPIVGIFDSAGAFLPEGVRALAGYGKIMKCISAASGVIPQIAVVAGYSSGASSVAVSMFDIVIVTEDKGSISVNPPFITEGAGNHKFASETGAASIHAKNDSDAVNLVKKVLRYLPENNEAGVPDSLSNDEVNRVIDGSEYQNGGSVKALISSFADDGELLELYSEYGREIVTGLASLGGTSVGIIACDRNVNNGTLTAHAARKAAKALSFFDAFNIPVISIVDCAGLDSSIEAEKSPYVAELSKLAQAYSSAQTPLITLIAGEAYGSVFTIMGSKAVGADLVVALDSAKIGAMNASSAVAFMYNDKVSADVTREELEKEWNETVASPVEAASSGEIDDIISSEEIRQRLTAAVYMLSRKSKMKPLRRHFNMPV